VPIAIDEPSAMCHIKMKKPLPSSSSGLPHFSTTVCMDISGVRARKQSMLRVSSGALGKISLGIVCGVTGDCGRVASNFCCFDGGSRRLSGAPAGLQPVKERESSNKNLNAIASRFTYHKSGAGPTGAPDTRLWVSTIPKGPSLPASHRRKYTLLCHVLLEPRLRSR
jgi:hypothetical protein